MAAAAVQPKYKAIAGSDIIEYELSDISQTTNEISQDAGYDERLLSNDESSEAIASVYVQAHNNCKSLSCHLLTFVA